MRPLPRGRHGLSREFVAQDQRQRLLAAIVEALDELGYDGATVSLIGTRARVSKSDFYRHFSSKDDCFVVAYDEAVEELRSEVLAACSSSRDWAEGICAGIAVMLRRFEDQPAQANLLLVEGLRAGPHVYGRYRVAVDSFVPYLRKGAPVASTVNQPQEADEAVVGGLASLLGRRVLAGETAGMEGIFPEVAEFVLSPYLGVAEARRIICTR